MGVTSETLLVHFVLVKLTNVEHCRRVLSQPDMHRSAPVSALGGRLCLLNAIRRSASENRPQIA
jgi:hypothetical protein